MLLRYACKKGIRRARNTQNRPATCGVARWITTAQELPKPRWSTSAQETTVADETGRQQRASGKFGRRSAGYRRRNPEEWQASQRSAPMTRSRRVWAAVLEHGRRTLISSQSMIRARKLVLLAMRGLLSSIGTRYAPRTMFLHQSVPIGTD